jgi:hypothetical protein
MLRYFSCFIDVHVLLFLLLCYCSCFITSPHVSLFLLRYFFYFVSLLLRVLHYCSCYASLLLLLHYSCYFVPPPSCIATMWCFIAPLPSQVLFYPLLLCYSFVLRVSLLPCPNWYIPRFLFFFFFLQCIEYLELFGRNLKSIQANNQFLLFFTCFFKKSLWFSFLDLFFYFYFTSFCFFHYFTWC